MTTADTRRGPTALETLRLGDGIAVLRAAHPLPGLGELAVNAFVLDGREPMLVDTGLAALREPILAALATELDPRRLRWIFISHADADHVGNLAAVLDAAPHARVLTGFLGQAKLALNGFPVERVEVIAPGDELDIGGQRIRIVRPPYYDAPETLGFHDATRGVLFAADAFGAVLPAVVPSAEDIEDEALERGLALWSALDAPWLTSLDPGLLAATLASLDALEPRHVLSAHLPPAHDVRSLTARVARLREEAMRESLQYAA